MSNGSVYIKTREGRRVEVSVKLIYDVDFLHALHGDPEAEYEKKLWLELADEKVLLTPGSYYTPWEGQGLRSTSAAGGQSYEIFFRLAYSMTTREEWSLVSREWQKSMLALGGSRVVHKPRGQ
ncbi:hypothetical protein BDZ89DRAFT_1150757 [Hymenopellis radicata]|nr:hypothetical protein BDZ89DRAFT_1150757 [Hymenopellis radicata]